jgi:hypothetical protein
LQTLLQNTGVRLVWLIPFFDFNIHNLIRC